MIVDHDPGDEDDARPFVETVREALEELARIGTLGALIDPRPAQMRLRMALGLPTIDEARSCSHQRYASPRAIGEVA